MNRRRMLAGAGLSLALLLGGGGGVLADNMDSGHENGDSGPNCREEGAPNAMGMQMKHAAQAHADDGYRGIAGATAWHNSKHKGDDLTVGEHQQMVKEACWSNPSGK